MRIAIPLVAVALLMAIAHIGSGAGLHYLFGVVIPYAALLLFVAGFIWKMVSWMKSPVPFNITTTAGQQSSFKWLKTQPLENPPTMLATIGRMALEVLLFRSLFRNTAAVNSEGRLTYRSSKFLWLFAVLFHWGFLIVLVRHLRFFAEPLPAWLVMMDQMDSLIDVGVPVLYLSGLLLLAGAGFLLLRRVVLPQMRYISLPADYFPLLLIVAIVLTGLSMRHLFRVDIMAVKELTLGLVTFAPTIPAGLPAVFYVHLFLVSVLFAYFPFSKLMHMGGVFLSPARNMPNNSRAVRHESPWMYERKIHPYSAYEDEFREKMREAGLPLDKE